MLSKWDFKVFIGKSVSCKVLQQIKPLGFQKVKFHGLKVLQDGFSSVVRWSWFGTHTNFRNSSYLLDDVISQKIWQGFRVITMTETITYSFNIPQIHPEYTWTSQVCCCAQHDIVLSIPTSVWHVQIMKTFPDGFNCIKSSVFTRAGAKIEQLHNL